MKAQQTRRSGMMIGTLTLLILSAAVAKASGAPLLNLTAGQDSVQPTAFIALAAGMGIFVNVLIRRKG